MDRVILEFRCHFIDKICILMDFHALNEEIPMVQNSMLFLSFLILIDLYPQSTQTSNTVGRLLPPDAASLDQQVFRYLSFEPASLDIGLSLYQSSESEFLFERLCMLNYNNDLIPGAADRWEVSDDELTWTFHLRKNAKWSDGRPVTAEDFEYSFKRFLHPDNGNVYASFYFDIKGAQAHIQRQNMNPESVGVTAIDEYTLQIETETPCAYLPYILAYPTSSPVPRWQIEKYGLKWTEPGRCVSNSSYQLESWDIGQSMSFSLNPYYNGALKGYLERIVRVFTEGGRSTGDIGLLAYENDEIDMTQVYPMDLGRIEAHPAMKDELAIFPRHMTTYLFFKTKEPPFNDIRVRQAFSHAIDRDRLTDTVLRRIAVPAYTMMPPGFPGYVGGKYKDIQQYDASRAKALLAEAGYPGGRGFPNLDLWTVNTRRIPTNTVSQAIQGMVQESLGINLKIRITESRTYRDAMNNWTIPISIATFDYDFPDPHSLLGMVWRSKPKGIGRHDWANPEFDRLIDQASTTLEEDQRFNMYDQAERILAEDVGGAFLFHSYAVRVRKPWTSGYPLDRLGYRPFYHNNSSWSDIYINNEVLSRRGFGLKN